MHRDGLSQRRRPDAGALRLICFPHAGGSDQAFSGWGARLPGVDVVGAELPGRGRRLREPAISDMATLVGDLIASLGARLQPPFALLGHSVGALVAYELACELQRRGCPAPCRLFVCGHRGPGVEVRWLQLHRLPDDALATAVLQIGATPAEAIADASLRALVLGTIRADLALTEAYMPTAATPLDVALSAFGGLHDPFVMRTELVAWSRTTAREFALRLFPGQHFFVRDSRDQVLSGIQRELSFP